MRGPTTGDADQVTLGGPTYSLLHRYADAVRQYDRALSFAPDLIAVALQSPRTTGACMQPVDWHWPG